MSLHAHACTPKVSDLVACIDAAVQVGTSDRLAASQSRQAIENHLATPARQEAETAIRVASVIAAIPLKVRHKVSHSMTWDNTVVVPLMELTGAEYPGAVCGSSCGTASGSSSGSSCGSSCGSGCDLRMPSLAPECSLDPSQLAYGGLGVWQYLELAGLTPRLKYIMDDDIRRYKLAIVIEVGCP